MRRTILVVTLVALAPTAVMALTPARLIPGEAAPNLTGEANITGLAGTAHPESFRGNVILAKGDKSGTGPGAGGHKGAHKGEKKGGQEHGQGQSKGKK